MTVVLNVFLHPLPVDGKRIFFEHYQHVIGFVNPEVLMEWYFYGKLNFVFLCKVSMLKCFLHIAIFTVFFIRQKYSFQ